MTATVVGVDLGGTLIRAAVATGPASHETPVRHPTPQQSADAVLDAIAAAVREAVGTRRCDRVAVGVPGPLDPRAGLVYEAPNLPGFHGLEVGRLLGDRLGCPISLQNDANLAGFAEWTAGAGVGTRDMVFITVSTGIGGAVIVDGELYGGCAGTAGEIGHLPHGDGGPPCRQGHPGCLEGMASGSALGRRAAEELAAGAPSSLATLPGPVDARAVEEAALAGDALALRLYAETGRALGRAVGGLVNLLSPEAVVIGGGLIGAGELLFGPMRAALPEMAFAYPLSRCRVVPAALGTDAGLVGACAWAVRSHG